ncbi:MAG: NAD-dependent epimerase/dehydratase family protein [Pseudomonadota bacterium]
MKRREVLQALALATTATIFGQRTGAATKGLRVLMLGGTGFIGPHTIEALRRGGHRITLFNNDKESAKKFPDLESLFGDRDGKIEALNGREWDVAIDNSGYVPRHVRLTADALKDRVGHYLFVSSISAYADLSKPGIDETYRLGTLADPGVEKVTEETYGPLKAACENVVRAAYGSRCSILRPTYIVGPGDSSDRFTYWPVRMSQGGEMLAPGTSGDPVQFIDVRDLAAFTAACAEHRYAGDFNVCNPPRSVSMGQLLESSRKISRASTKVVWVDAKFIEAQKFQGNEIPIWSPTEGEFAGASLVESARAVAKGLKFRSLDSTVADTLAWHTTRPSERREKLRAGLGPDQEHALLEKWLQSKSSR